MTEIKRIVIVGMGALGMLYGSQIKDGSDNNELFFLLDEERLKRHINDRPVINGKRYDFNMITPEEYSGTADLVIFATKYHGLRSAAELAAPVIGQDTTIISVLNGISSEEILAEYYGRDRIIDCVAIGMDAMRNGAELDCQNSGRLQAGARDEAQLDRLAKLTAFFETSHMPHEICEDIKHAMWNKFMINVGINQTCMVYETTYEGATAPGPAHDDMIAAMQEVVEVAKAEGVKLTEEDLAKDLLILKNLKPDGYPSMRQDALANRPTEVDLFAGTVVRLAAGHGIAVPVNERFLKTIREMEAGYKLPPEL